MKLIVICGAKNSKGDLLAMKLANNSDCIWIKPFTDRPRKEEFDLKPVSKEKLTHMMDNEDVLAVGEVNGYRYVFFKNQLTADFVVLIGDDRVVTYLKNNWDGDLMTIKCHSKSEEYSERNLLSDDEFDVVFDYDRDDLDLLMYKIEDIYNFQVK